jgi:hypothetical protein
MEEPMSSLSRPSGIPLADYLAGIDLPTLAIVLSSPFINFTTAL